MIWLTGNKGMLGSEVEKLLKERGLTYWASDKEVDIGDYKALEKFGKDKKIKWVINCAGYTKVDKAEEEIDEAFRINKGGARNIALFSVKRQIKLIHISTDYVFDGNKDDVRGYKEDDKANPLSVYGKSKFVGEKEIRKILNEFFIIRTAWLYGLNGNNFVFTMLRLFREKEVIKIVDDQQGSPTYSADLADIILKVIERGSDKFGIYHFTNEGVTSWYEFAKAIYGTAKRLELFEDDRKVGIKPIRTENYPTAAKRPRYSVLSKDKIKREFDLKIRNWNEALEDFLSSLKINQKKSKMF